MAVAVVMMAARAMAMAPVIGDIPSPVVGPDVGVTETNIFVYPDALNLPLFVRDRETTDPTKIIWTYEIVGSPKYSINNAPSLAPLDNPTTPTAILNKIIAGQNGIYQANDTDPGRADYDPNTVTIRNTNLSPIGSEVNTTAFPDAIIDAETQLVTFYATDLSTSSQKMVWFYTTGQGNDYLSPGGVRTYSSDFPTTIGGFRYTYMLGSFSSSYSQVPGQLCLTTVGPGDNAGVWSGPFGMLQLVANSVYKIRALVNGTQSATNTTPFWDLIVNNYGYDAQGALRGMNLYGANYFFFDNTGGVNSPIGQGGGDVPFEMWFTPSPVSTTQWGDTSELQPGPWAASNATDRNAFIEFRILDTASNLAIHAETSLGTLCLRQVDIDRYDLNMMHVLTGYGLYDVDNLTENPQDQSTATGNTRLDFGSDGVTATWSGGDITLTPTVAGQTNMLAMITPGDFAFDYFNQTLLQDNYPVPMDALSLYQIEFELSAPTLADAASPPDIIWIGADTVSNELIYLSYVTLQGWHHGMPNTTPQSYKAFFHSNYGTKTGTGGNPAYWSSFRPRYMSGNNTSLGGGAEANSGAIKISRITAHKVAFEGPPSP
jgi:hypothetical protein